ncbi:MAG: sulfite oxidase-like oxidoreductase [Nitrososphaerales archaeon]
MEKAKSLPMGQHYINRFIIYSALGIPNVDLQKWRLTIDGEVEQTLILTYNELLSQQIWCEVVRDFHCVTKWSVPSVKFGGVKLKDLALRAKPKPQSKYVLFGCLDGYTTTVPIEDAFSEDAIIVLKVDGQPLRAEQGFPARPFIPHLYAWKSAKWLHLIRFLREYVDGYWEARGYHERGNVWSEERFKKEI